MKEIVQCEVTYTIIREQMYRTTRNDIATDRTPLGFYDSRAEAEAALLKNYNATVMNTLHTHDPLYRDASAKYVDFPSYYRIERRLQELT